MLKNPIYLWCMVLFPLAIVFFFTSIMKSGQPAKMPVGVVDLDGTTTSRSLIRRLDSFKSTRVLNLYPNVTEARKAMQRNEIYAFLLIPEDLAVDLKSSRQPKLSFYYSNTTLTSGSLLYRDLKTVSTLGSAGAGSSILSAKGLTPKQKLAPQIVLSIGYDTASLDGPEFRGNVARDWYGRNVPKPAHGSINLPRQTSSTRLLSEAVTELFDRIADPDLTVRRIGIAACNLIPEDEIPAEGPVQLDFFTDPTEEEKRKQTEEAADAKERKLQLAALAVHGKYGKNALLKAMNLQEGATARERNEMVGGHRAGSEEEGIIR